MNQTIIEESENNTKSVFHLVVSHAFHNDSLALLSNVANQQRLSVNTMLTNKKVLT